MEVSAQKYQVYCGQVSPVTTSRNFSDTFQLVIKRCSSGDLHEIFMNKHDIRFNNLKLIVKESKLSFFPKQLTEYFPHVRAVKLINCDLTEVTKENFKNLELMTVLDLSDNLLTSLPGNLFAYTPNLERISLQSNKLMSIGPELLDNLKALEYANFKSNLYINAVSDQNNTNSSSSVSLSSLKWIIRNCCKVTKNEEPVVLQSKALTSEALKDFTISVDGKNEKVHRFVLAAQSPVLMEKFNDNPDSKFLELVGVSYSVLKTILSFLYERQFPSDDNEMLEVYAAAGKLKIELLRRYTEDELLRKVDASNALEVLWISKNYKSDQLSAKAFEVIKSLMPDKLIKDEWKSQPEKLSKLLLGKKDETVEEDDRDYQISQCFW